VNLSINIRLLLTNALLLCRAAVGP